MKMSVKNLKAFNQGKEDRKNGVPFENNYFQYMKALTSSSYWDKGWKEKDSEIYGYELALIKQDLRKE